MGPHVPVLSGREARRALEKAGFAYVSRRGGHVKLRQGRRVVVVPTHKERTRGTLRSVLTQAGPGGPSSPPLKSARPYAEAPGVPSSRGEATERPGPSSFLRPT
ncbi:type II toxin-antitoxin system HicA family toxin [Nocardiopsis sp. CNR-923]|uniref:type II toxin-antitoxin system HicA family toxin n=1 Tax=Nocardiopsis sp. CNR-923 TaxID=1904965 RepID=UPI00096A626B|nr:type II toxin-antitoxin system HicA family toxin [Nocardiopsis sp. CNR-923]